MRNGASALNKGTRSSNDTGNEEAIAKRIVIHFLLG